MPNEPLIAEVIVDVPSQATDRPYDYIVPEELVSELSIGSRVRVPFGNRTLLGYVTQLKKKSSTNKRLKPILDCMDLLPPLTPELIQLGQYMAEEYLCHTITAFNAMVPAVLKGKYRKVIRVNPKASSSAETVMDLTISLFLQELRVRGELNWEEACRYPGMSASLLRQMIKDRLIEYEEYAGDRITRKMVTLVKPVSTDKLKEALTQLSSRATRQREVIYHFLKHPGEISLPELLTKLKVSRSVVQKLVESKILIWEEREVLRDPYQDRTFQKTVPLSLTEEQLRAFEAIIQPVKEKRFHTVLLHGVTGSGKTEVYLQSIEEALRAGREAIVLVPEISLTPQMVNRFKGRFGSQVAVLHSGLSSGERFDEWRKIRWGKVKVAIGARSAIFAPFQNIGLIIIDEEHESSYKQEENPKYHARDIALWRAKKHGATLVLGSATPALESYYQAKTGTYEWIQLKHRVHARPFPTVEVVDMRAELRKGNRSLFSLRLKEELLSCIERNEQAVLFLNRRGYSTFIMCRECGEALMCPRCDISLTYHQTNRTVRCHYCGYAEIVPTTCPHCQSRYIRHFGTGTQRVEEELTRQFPGIRVIRMDVDTTSRKGAHEQLLTRFSERKADVLLGTQMIAKGLDFPHVTLVGVIAADSMLHLPDFRASERTFQLLTQVSGRAGRHEKPGKVIIQTYSMDHYSIQCAALHQTDEFYRKESILRKKHLYPPYCGLFHILLSHPDRLLLLKAGDKLAFFIKQNMPKKAQLLGPVPAPIPKIKDRYRIQVLIKHEWSLPTVQRLKAVLRQIQSLIDDPELRISIDREGLYDDSLF